MMPTTATGIRLPVVVPPLDDECLGSWLGRIAAYYSIPVWALLASIGIAKPVGQSKNWLHFKPPSASDVLTLATVCRRSQKAITSMATSPWGLGVRHELGMCALCLIEDHAAERPVYWRRAWLDAVSVGCLKHAVWLTPLDAGVFLRAGHWSDAAPIMLGSAAQQVHAPPARTTFARLDLSALHLQALFGNHTGSVVARSRYRMACAEQARQVAIDLLDILLMIDPATTRRSALSEFASFLNLPLGPTALSVGSQSIRSMAIRHVHSLEARAFALAITDALMFASARLDEPDVANRPYDAHSLRVNWLWPFLPQAALQTLGQRARNWPRDYICACWPELESAEQSPMLLSSKSGLQRYLIRASMRRGRRQYANIGAN